MFKTLINKDELEEQFNGKGSLAKMDKLTKKEILEKEKPIHPKYIFEKTPKKKLPNSKYRKPKPPPSDKPKIINLYDY
jgi:hypothetical protein